VKEQEIRLLQVVNDAFVLPYFIGDQLLYFKGKGVKQFIACNESDFLHKYLVDKGVPYFGVPIRRSINPFIDLAAVWRLFWLIKKTNVNAVFGHTPKGAMLAMIAALLAGVKNRVYFRHGLVYETATGFKRKLLIAIEKLTSRLATTVVNVSESVLQRTIVDHIGSEYKNIILSKGTCNGIDVLKFSRNKIDKGIDLMSLIGLPETAFVVGYVGRIVRDKGVIDLLDAWQLVINEVPNARLLLVGPFEERDAIPTQIRDFIENSNSIIHVDFTEDVIPYYNLMDVLILASYREGFPTVVLEASSMQIPVITTRATGCIDSILSGETGFFVTHEPNDIKEKILYYYNNPQVKVSHGVRGREFVVQNFKQEVIWTEIEEKLLYIK